MTHSSDIYDWKEHKQQILDVPDTYLGSISRLSRKERIVVFSDGNWIFKRQSVDIPQGAVRCFMEILTNASDNVVKSRNKNINPFDIKVNMDQYNVEVINHGLVIPIIKKLIQKGSKDRTAKERYIPEVIFGKLLSSSNYGGVRIGGGRNGYGAKLANLFSKEFHVDVGDKINGKRYQQTWRNNMTMKEEPIITNYKKKSYVRISYKLDFPRFDMKRYSKKDIGLFARYCADVSFNCKVDVVFNGSKLRVKSMKDFSSKLFPGIDNKLCFNYEGKVRRKVPDDVTMDQKEYNKFTADVCIVDVQDSLNYSYVNGMETTDGGLHIEALTKAFSDAICPIINEGKVAKSRSYKINKRSIRGKVSFVVSLYIPDPTFDSQMKFKLNSPPITIKIPDNMVNKIKSWNVLKVLNRNIEATVPSLTKKTDGKKVKYVNIYSAEDAKEAGGKKSDKCTLYIIEGLSAAGYVVNGLNPGDRDYIGIYPMRGKVLNVKSASEQRYIESRVIIEIKKMIGLEEEVDYSIKSNFNRLRYGRAVIIGDADSDGTHIIALVINFFNENYKSLIKIGYVNIFRTPIVRVNKGRKTINFYTMDDYEDWIERTNTKGWKHKYCKGLGSSSEIESKKDFSDPKISTFVHDDKADDNFELAFSRDKTKERKDWIRSTLCKRKFNVNAENINMSDFINSELIEYSYNSLKRSIPSFIDGLKEVQRKIIWGSIVKWKIYTNKQKQSITVYKVGSEVASLTAYRHGPSSINSAIIEMTSFYVGSNNMPYFFADGYFGTRNGNAKGCGKDAADPRYCSVKPQEWWNYIYRKEDLPLLSIQVDDDSEIEPKFLLPIIPMILVNGSRGIATGWNTYIPHHNPIDIVNWLIDKLDGKEPGYIYPWYRGFKGKVDIVRRKVKIKDEESDETDLISLEDLDPNSSIAIRTSGIIEQKKNELHITEIPISVSIHNYAKWIRYLHFVENKISDFSNYSDANNPHFIIKGMKNPTLKNLKLTKCFGLSSMNCLNDENIPSNYRTSKDILNAFYEFRLPFYQKRKDSIIDEMEQKLDFLNNKVKFLRLICIEKKIEIRNIKKSLIFNKMVENGIKNHEKVYSSITISNCSKDEIDKILSNIDKLKKQLEIIRDTDIKSMWKKDIKEFLDYYTKFF